jgi:hypothetical protein
MSCLVVCYITESTETDTLSSSQSHGLMGFLLWEWQTKEQKSLYSYLFLSHYTFRRFNANSYNLFKRMHY